MHSQTNSIKTALGIFLFTRKNMLWNVGLMIATLCEENAYD
jgi:hypothetical protein